MSKAQLFVEGIADQKFFQDLLQEWYGVKLTKGKFTEQNTNFAFGDIFDMGGKDTFDDPIRMALLDPIIETLQFEEVAMLVIFDADTYTVSKPIVEELCAKRNFNYFLLPYNGTHPESSKNDGDLESLLQEIICPDNQVILDCWHAYEACLIDKPAKTMKSGKFTLPARKTKIYAYLEALVGESKKQKAKIKEENRDYRNKDHWNLNPAHPALQPLKTFLDNHFSPQP